MGEYSPKLPKSTSSCLGSWNCSSRRTAGFTRVFFDNESLDEFTPVKKTPTRFYVLWLWRKILMKEKKKMKMLNCCMPSNMEVHVPYYNPYTYAQNFDEGCAWIEPDNLCRSFSARFAAPSRLLQSRVKA